MGRVVVDFEVSNYSDQIAVNEGRLPPEQVRKMVVSGIVDTGATRMVLPENVVQFLGLPIVDRSTVRFADQRKAERNVVSNAYVELLGRSGMFKAVVEPNRPDALIGAIVMEDLDLIVDCSGQKLIPRDPNTLLTEIE